MSGVTPPEEFDSLHLRRLGNYGFRALQDVRSSAIAAEHTGLSVRIDTALEWRSPMSPFDAFTAVDAATVRALIAPVAGTDEPPESLWDGVRADRSITAVCAGQGMHCEIASIDLDGLHGWLIFSRAPGLSQERIFSSWLLRQRESDGRWLFAGQLGTPQCLSVWVRQEPPQAVLVLPEVGPFVRIGNCAYQVMIELEPRVLGD